MTYWKTTNPLDEYLGPDPKDAVRDCPDCNGTGTCSECEGKGCGECDGSGLCDSCDGTGLVPA